MEIDNLKKTWKNTGTTNLNTESMRNMIRAKNHPVLKGIRKQLIFETLIWIIFLFSYYDMFDGDQKPFYANMLLITAVILLIIHNLIGFLSQQKLIKGMNLKQSLEAYLSSIRVFRIFSIATRVTALICLLLFFTSIISFNSFRYGILAALMMLIPIQAFILNRIWNRRINQLKKLLKEFSE